MIQFTTLGSLDLRTSDGRVLQAIVVQPKRLALLTYLALDGRGCFHQRDTLLAMFWPELDSDRARNALNKAVHYLRAELGEAVLLGRGDRELGVDSERLWCDASTFVGLVRERRLTEALELYRGDLLPGFFLSGAPEFERWLEEERGRLRRVAAEAAGTLAAQEEATGNLPAAVARARQAVALAPGDEPGLRRLLTTLDRSGDKAGALQALEEWAKRLGEDSGLEPSAETLKLAEDIRSPAWPRQVTPHHPVTELAPAGIPSGAPPHVQVGEPQSRPRFHLSRLAPLVGLSLPIILAMVWATWPRSETNSAAPASKILVVPFRISGADSSLAYLGEGMVDLLGARLSGAGGIQVVDPYAAVSAWRPHRESGLASGTREAQQIAAGHGATLVIGGRILGDASHLTLDASIVSVGDGHQLGVASVAGATDSLLELVDRLAVQLLSHDIGLQSERLSGLDLEPLSAVRAYLDGVAAYRRGEYNVAVNDLEQALKVDSAFALAALELVLAAGILPEPDGLAFGERLAWAARSHLDPTDRVLLIAFTGADYPRHTSGLDRLNRFDSAATMAPDRPDIWFMLGDQLYHFGPALGIEDPRARATAAFERALVLDPAFEAPLEHLVDLAATTGDVERLESLGNRYLSLHGESEHADYVRWRMAVARGDEVALRSLRAHFNQMHPATLGRIAGVAQLDGVAMEDADRAIASLRKQAASLDQRRDWWTGAQRLELFSSWNRGRVREALRQLEAMYREDPRVPFPSVAVSNALYLGGPAEKAESTARALLRDPEQHFVTPIVPGAGRLVPPCVAALWVLSKHDTATASRVARLLTRALADSATAAREHPLATCLAGLEANLALTRGDPAAPRLLDHFDSLVTSRTWDWGYLAYANLDVARLREASGNLPAALRAVRRREYQWIAPGLIALSTYLRREGELAQRTGDTAGAIRAYRHYLALRSDPDAELIPERDSVRTALTGLSGHP